MFERFFHSEVSSSLVLIASTVAALVWANSPWAGAYFDFAHTPVSLSWGESVFSLSLHHWVNDGLMVLFFFVVGLEIKREVVVGQLSTLRQAALPVAAAVGGMLVPAAFYAAFNYGGVGADGWGVPMATDIAFALGILALLGKRVPLGLKVFLTALAIADDLGAVMVIALFYTDDLNLLALGISGALLVLLLVAVHFGARRVGLYLFLALGIWFAVFFSGIHATVAGILVALLVPVRVKDEPRQLITVAQESLRQLAASKVTAKSLILEKSQFDTLLDLSDATVRMLPAGLVFERYLHKTQAFIILPLFAFFNAGVSLSADSLAWPPDPITLGIVVGLVFGKQIGVTLAAWLAVKSGLADLPNGVTWGQIYGAACLAGVGFTMSLFIGELAFSDPTHIGEAKIGILIASLIAGLWGFLSLQRSLDRQPE
jgi:NhaA family Na+:H+ antiporter